MRIDDDRIEDHPLRNRWSSAVSQSSPIVFIRDDDISVRESLEALVLTEGWRVETFSSGQAFLARPRPQVPSCLILDVNLPDLNGLDVQKRIAGDRTDMPIIFITGYGDIPMTVRAMKAGAVEFLTKPFDEESLLGFIRHSLGRSESRPAGRGGTSGAAGTATPRSVAASGRSWRWYSRAC